MARPPIPPNNSRPSRTYAWRTRSVLECARTRAAFKHPYAGDPKATSINQSPFTTYSPHRAGTMQLKYYRMNAKTHIKLHSILASPIGESEPRNPPRFSTFSAPLRLCVKIYNSPFDCIVPHNPQPFRPRAAIERPVGPTDDSPDQVQGGRRSG